jgi:molybdate transport system ATP-binding protein
MSLVADVTVVRGAFRLCAQLRADAGEVVAVLGPNGAGKTTLLRALAGLLPLDAGRVEVGGRVWDAPADGAWVPPVERGCGLVFQDYRLFPHLPVRDNVAFGLRARGAGRAAARTAVQPWLERLGLAELADRRPAALSGGQAQRVALARALAATPSLLLLDEPLAALDARTRLDVRGLLREHLSGFPGPSVVVTHDPLEALVLADRVVVLEGGRVVQEGPPALLARRPATEYVARLMGLNLWSGVLVDDVERRVALDAGGSVVAAGRAPDEAPPAAGDRVLVAVAPSALAVSAEEPVHGSPRNRWPGRVTGLELLTDRVRLAVEGEPPALADVTPSAVAELRLDAGSPVWLSAKATEVVAYAAPHQASR